MPAPESTARISQARRPSIWMADQSRRLRRLATDIDLGGYIFVLGETLAFGDDSARTLRVFFADQDDHASKARKHILNHRGCSQIVIDAGRVKQALHHDRFGFIFGIEYFYQLFIGIRSPLGWCIHRV